LGEVGEELWFLLRDILGCMGHCHNIWKRKEREKNTKSAMFLPSGCGPNPF